MTAGSTADASWLESRGFRAWLGASALAHLVLALMLALQRHRPAEPELSPVYVAVVASLPAARKPEPVAPPPAAVEPIPIPPPVAPPPRALRPPVPLPPPPQTIRPAPPPATPRPAPAPPPPPETRPLFPSAPAPLGRHTPDEDAPRIERANAPQRVEPPAKLPALLAAAPVPVPADPEPERLDRVRTPAAPAPARAPLRVPAAAAPIAAPPEERSSASEARVARPLLRQPPPAERRSAPQAAPPPPPLASRPATAARSAPLRSAAAPPSPAAAARSSKRDPGIRGVPLDSLAACVSDADEERWKRRVLAAVGSRESCTSAAGSYRFVETKNLNAFLMWIERANDRSAGDRCEELGLALECLASSGGQGRGPR